MAGTLMDGKVCPNHPETAATSRCTTCFKPLCQECTIVKGNLDFCSDKCATNHFVTNASIEDGFNRDAAARRRARIIKMIFLLILLVAFFSGVYYWKTQLKKSDREKLLNKVKKVGKDAKKLIDQ